MDEITREVAKQYDIDPKVLQRAFELQFKFLLEIADTIDPLDPSSYENKVVYLRSFGKFIPDARVMSNMTVRNKRHGQKGFGNDRYKKHNQRMEELSHKEENDRGGSNEESKDMFNVSSCEEGGITKMRTVQLSVSTENKK